MSLLDAQGDGWLDLSGDDAGGEVATLDVSSITSATERRTEPQPNRSDSREAASSSPAGKGGERVSRPPQTPTRRVKSQAPRPRPELPERTLASRSWAGGQAIPNVKMPQGPAREPGARVLATKVDSLYLSFHVVLSDDLLDALENAKEEARSGEGGVVAIMVGGKAWRVECGAAGPRHPFRLTNEFASLGVSKTRSKNVPALKFQLRAAFLWEFEVEGAWAWAEEIARAVNVGSVAPRAILSRADLCADVTGVDFSVTDLEDFVMRARRKTRHRHTGGENDPSCSECGGTGKANAEAAGEHFSGRTLTGYSFGKSEVSARIYDKTREIREVSRDKFWLYDVWSKRGWVGTEPVWRVEAQFRREALKELVSRTTAEKLDLDELGTPEEKLDAQDCARRVRPGFRGALPSLWGYMVGGERGHKAWLKWCVPSETDRKRANWKIRPEWRVIQGADWRSPEREELVRIKRRAATYNRLLPQLVGLASTIAALRGPNLDGRAPMLHELEEDVRVYLERMKVRWEELVNAKRVTCALWDLVDVGPKESVIRRALKMAESMGGPEKTLGMRAYRAALLARAEEN